MSNLGYYQIMTTMAKKVGGPKNLFAIIACGSAIIGGCAVAGGNALKNKITSELKNNKKAEAVAKIYTVNKVGKSNEGLQFNVGDMFKLLEMDGDAGLIEIIGDNNNPYFISRKFLSTISDYCL